MYSQAVVAAQQEKLQQALGKALPNGRLQALPVAHCRDMTRRLTPLWDPQKRQQVRPLSQDEQAFVANEQLLTKIDYRYWAERYCMIQRGGATLAPMYPLWESQELILAELARVEEARWHEGHPDGLLPNTLKGRQLGASTFFQSILAHRITTHTYFKALIASDVPENSGSQGLFGMLELVVANLPWWLKPSEVFHTKDKHIVFRTGSSIIVESGKSMKGGLQEEGGQKGNLGRSKTYAGGHLSELSTWERPQQIDDGLMPAIPISPRTFLAKESTAKGRYNWWHREWLVAEKGLGRSFNIFIPFYAERSKYWLPCPGGWIPTDDTLAFARRVQEKGPRYMHRSVTLSKEQLYWYERSRAAAVEKNELFKFLEEYPAEPEEAFQYSGRSIFPVMVIDRVEKQARPLKDLWTIAPHADLLADKDALMAELKLQQATDKQAIAAEQLRRQGTPVEGPQAQRVQPPPPPPDDEPAGPGEGELSEVAE